MRHEDAPAVHALAEQAFADLARRLGHAPDPPRDAAAAHLRLRHLVAADPGGAWVAEGPEGLQGAALALVREGVWGLSLLVVAPGAQSAGLGRALLARALAHGADARGGLILASDDARALRSYARAGFALHPAFSARGVPRPLADPPALHRGEPADVARTVPVDRLVRGGGRPRDVAMLLAAGATLLLLEDRGYAVLDGGVLRTLAARDEPSAQALLRGALAAVPPGTPAGVEFLTARQGWALPVLLEAGLELRVGGALFVRGDVGPLTPYVPSGAYL